MTIPIIRKKTILWKIEYHIHVEHIDTEHKQLFDIAQEALEINSSINQEKRTIELKNIISKLLMYTKIHFAHEQRYMKEINYPDLNHHITLHKNMVDSLTFLIKELNNLDLYEIENKLFVFIEEYFLHHIITEDKKIHIWNTPLEDLKKDFGWKEFYSVANQFIDNDHKILFDIAHEAFKTVDSPDRISKIRTIIRNLYDYMKKHFENEEKYMREIGYPFYETHKELHENLIIQLNEFIKQLAQIKLTLFEKELARIIDITLLQHIIQEDRKIIAWIKSNPIQNN